jgi:hypothetical protein
MPNGILGIGQDSKGSTHRTSPYRQVHGVPSPRGFSETETVLFIFQLISIKYTKTYFYMYDKF